MVAIGRPSPARLALLDRIAGDLPGAAARADPDRAAERAGRDPTGRRARTGRGGRRGRRQRRHRGRVGGHRFPRPAGRPAGRGRCGVGLQPAPVGPGDLPARRAGVRGAALAGAAPAGSGRERGHDRGDRRRSGPDRAAAAAVGRPGGGRRGAGSDSPRPSGSGSGRVRSDGWSCSPRCSRPRSPAGGDRGPARRGCVRAGRPDAGRGIVAGAAPPGGRPGPPPVGRPGRGARGRGRRSLDAARRRPAAGPRTRCRCSAWSSWSGWPR